VLIDIGYPEGSVVAKEETNERQLKNIRNFSRISKES
jgi:hypothetical protein